MGSPDPNSPEKAGEYREYRIAELAEKAGITVRTLRFYRERKLIPPPRREGRVAWYNDHHLARLHTIAALLERGHTLGGIAELLAAFDSGARDVADLLGLRSTLIPVPVPAWSQETPVRLTPEALADYFQGQATPENLAAALDLGYLTVDGDQLVHVSRRLLDVSRDLVDRGLPLAAVLGAARDVRHHVEAIAEVFAALLRTTVLAEPASRIGATLEELRPMAEGVVEAELSMAMDRRIRADLAAWAEGDQDRG
ncbi:MerR family transcriptional regulator [Streptomyces milbemycinicus]|uniref:MerR family transcriptional regulator n=1 Tax=Streptomyces milbemycinicus TaxID=476552 RepID=A0ABW8LX47_9ACTN